MFFSKANVTIDSNLDTANLDDALQKLFNTAANYGGWTFEKCTLKLKSSESRARVCKFAKSGVLNCYTLLYNRSEKSGSMIIPSPPHPDSFEKYLLD